MSVIPVSQSTEETAEVTCLVTGCLGQLSIWLSILTGVMISGLWDQAPHWANAGDGAYLRFPLSLSLPLTQKRRKQKKVTRPRSLK